MKRVKMIGGSSEGHYYNDWFNDQGHRFNATQRQSLLRTNIQHNLLTEHKSHNLPLIWARPLQSHECCKDLVLDQTYP